MLILVKPKYWEGGGIAVGVHQGGEQEGQQEQHLLFFGYLPLSYNLNSNYSKLIILIGIDSPGGKYLIASDCTGCFIPNFEWLFAPIGLEYSIQPYNQQFLEARWFSQSVQMWIIILSLPSQIAAHWFTDNPHSV